MKRPQSVQTSFLIAQELGSMSKHNSVKISSLVRDGMLVYNDGYRTKSAELSPIGLPILRVAQINEGRIVGAPTDFIDPSYDQKIGLKKSQIGDVVLTTKGTIGRVARIKDATDVGYAYSPQVIWSRPYHPTLSKFLFYALQSRQVQNQLRVLSEQTDMAPYINLHDFGLVEIVLPSEDEQEAIAEVLSSLDDKIDLLKRQNKTLEGMAEALFRQWFIEEAQDDWEEYSASDFVEHIKESENPQSKPDTWFSHFSLPAFDDGKKPSMEKGEEIKSNKYVVQANSLLVSKLNPGTPRVWHCGSTLPQNPICSTEFQVIKPQAHLLGFFRCLYSSNEVVEFLSACASGTSGSHQRVKPKDIVDLAFHAPSHDSMIKFSSITADWFEKILENQEQILTLENERNTLLPKLMSGEVRVNLD